MSNQLANEFGIQEAQNHNPGVVASSESSKEMERVKGQIFMAKQYPRNQFQAMNRIIDSMKRPTAAKQAAYSYPRGGMQITGPSIRLAEIVAQNWGNMTYGVRELEQFPGESLAQAYAWDLETNVFVEKTFKVSHTRKKGNSVQKLTDPRDIYELVANYGARRLRAAIMEVVPADIFEKALEEADKTLNNQNSEPLQDRLAKILKLFDGYNVSQEMLEERFGRKYDSFTERNVIDLGNIFNSLKDGVGKVEDFFKVSSKPEKEKKTDIEKEFDKKQDQKLAGGVTVKAKADEDNEAGQQELL